MALLFRFFACCQSSKSVENEREGQEFRLTSPRFAAPYPQNVHGNHKFASSSPKEANNNIQNEQTFNQGDMSMHLESPNLKAAAEPNFGGSQNVSFQNLQESNNEEDTNKSGKENTGRFEDRNIFNDQSFGEKETQPFRLSQPDPEKRSKFAVQKMGSFGQNNVTENINESKTTIGGFLVMNKIKRAEDDPKNKDALRKNVSREILNSTPPMRPVGKAI